MALENKFHEEKEEAEKTPCLGVKHVYPSMFTQRNVLLDVLMACWGLGTWLGVNGLYVQLPLLVERLPEGWALPASMVLAVQLANVGLLVYAVMRRLLPQASDSPYIYSLLAIGALSLTLNAFLYRQTLSVGSNETSFAFLSFTFFSALVGCTSSVLFYPYLRHFKDMYLATYLAGEGLSGFLPSILALIQGVGGEAECLPSSDGSYLVPHYPPPRFNSTVFMLVLAALSMLSLLSFIFLNNCKRFNNERVAQSIANKEEEADSTVSILRARWILVLAVMACLNALSNGVLPSVQSYSCMPYGTLAYHLAVTLGAMATPSACLAGVWLKPVPGKVLTLMLMVTLVPFSYIMATALTSPTPPLSGTVIGTILVVTSWVLTSALVSYSRMWIYGWARQGGAKGMRVCGTVTQVGSAVGSLVLFCLVNYTQLFVQPNVCPAS